MPGRPKGLPKTGGRQKGVMNKVQADVRELMKKAGFNPIRRMIAIANDKTVDIAIRAQMTKELAKYYAPQLKAIEHSGEVETGQAVVYLPRPLTTEDEWSHANGSTDGHTVGG